MTTMIITVNLECHICIKKIKKAIGKLQERNDIKSFEYDEKKGIITISGKFDPDVISKKLCSTACEAIIDIQEKPDNPPPPPPSPPPRLPPPPPSPPPVSTCETKIIIKPETFPYPVPYPYPYHYPVPWPYKPACVCGSGCGSQTGSCHCKFIFK